MALVGVLVAVAMALVGVGLVAATSAQGNRWLEDQTGETVLKEQVQNVIVQSVQRPRNTADIVPVAHAGVYPYGANVFFEQEVEEWKLRRSMEMLR